VAARRILVIDDDEVFRSILRQALERSGFEVSEAASGREAQSRWKAAAPDLILLDIMMPDVDGVTLCREIRAQESLQDVPVVMLSALGDAQTVNDALLFGATDYLVKPADITAIVEKIEKALRQADSRRRLR
jgi:DNA-binding response OmpR family regulator